ncbi:MAG: pilus assembly protein N-terminal domain-containing protein [Caulobacterales bacterium]|jgi:hypothetical protein
MRRLSLALLLALAPGVALAAGLQLGVDQAARVTLPRPAQDVIIGNPAIADVTVADSRHLIVVGKTYGITNLVVADATGHTMYNSQIVVGGTDDGRVTVFQGQTSSDYACSPRCERAGGTAAAPAAGGGGAPTTGPIPPAS